MQLLTIGSKPFQRRNHKQTTTRMGKKKKDRDCLLVWEIGMKGEADVVEFGA